MATSTTLPPVGQRHDRDDANMQDSLTNGLQPDPSSTPIHIQTDSVAIEVAAVSPDEDAMDTTSDDTQDLVQPNGAVQPTGITPPSPPPVEDMNNEAATNTAVSTRYVFCHATLAFL